MNGKDLEFVERPYEKKLEALDLKETVLCIRFTDFFDGLLMKTFGNRSCH